MGLSTLAGTLQRGDQIGNLTETQVSHAHFQCESFAAFYADAAALIRAHWDEVASLPEARQLDVHEQKYLELERKELLLCVTARRDGELVGYVIGLIAPDLHAKAGNMIVCDVYYVEPSSRREGIAGSMFDFYNASAKIRGCKVGTMRQKLVNGVPMASDRMFEVMGYEKQEVVWFKRL